MPFKMVTDRKKQCRDLTGPALEEGRAQAVMQGILRRLSDVVPEGTEVLTLVDVQRYLGLQLLHQFRQLGTSDQRHGAALVTDRTNLALRKRWADLLFERMTEVRNVWDGNFGAGSSIQLFGIEGEIFRDPERMHQQAEQGYEVLTQVDLAMPAPRLVGAVVDPAVLAASLEEPMIELGKALTALSRHRRTASVDAQLAKNVKIREHDRLLLDGGRVLEALYDLAGMREEGKRLRPAPRRPRSLSPGPIFPDDGPRPDDGPDEPPDDSPDGSSPDGSSPDGSSPNDGSEALLARLLDGPAEIEETPNGVDSPLL